MVKKCFIKSCKREWQPNSFVSYHCFPLKKKQLLEKWMRAIPEGHGEPKNYHYICSQHFTEDAFDEMTMERRRLKNGAVPTVFSDAVDTTCQYDLQIASSSETDPRTSTEPPEDFQRNKRPLSTSPPEVTPPEPKRQTLIPPPTRTFQEPTRRSTPQPTWYPPQTSSGCQYQDEFSTFGQHVANQLRCLPLGNAIVCQNYINNYLAEERLKVINEGCGYYRHDAVPTTSRCVADDRNVGTVDYHHHASATASNSSMEPMEDFLDDFSSDQKLDFIKVEDNSDDLL